jgi:hypothetical protein
MREPRLHGEGTPSHRRDEGTKDIKELEVVMWIHPRKIAAIGIRHLFLSSVAKSSDVSLA